MTQEKTILIVDDDKPVRETLQQIIEMMGHKAIQADRAIKASRVLEDTDVHAMLLDLQMPGTHGDRLLQFLRKRKGSLPPTIVISGHVQRHKAGPLIQLGVEGIIAKPFRVQRVVEELKRVLAIPRPVADDDDPVDPTQQTVASAPSVDDLPQALC
ncbi:MAG: response regulator [Gemmatimonadetes bacterium]|nr:response regulator [Gemmatimonadota bacterium]MBT5142092.1 response regulator [Gemmatimonadota bacterium]MBT5588474.1 response regulator [Gemmatimonadota bacterium]MBT5963027.1 response regulator [Gemmatimonadota bacterium]MBT6630128.1 response regulator [Gemmatimonadota bacterium]